MSPAGPSLTVATVFLVVVWYATSMLAITTSKLVMDMVRVPLVLCSAQFACAVAVSGAVLLLQGVPLAPCRGGFRLLAATSATYTLGFFFTNFAFSLANASFVETVKSAEPISTVVMAFALLGEREHAGTYASLMPVVLGVAMASSGDGGGNLLAFLATAASNFGFSARAVFAKQLKGCPEAGVTSTSDVALFFHISWLGLVCLLPFAVASDRAALQGAFEGSAFDARRFFGVMALNGLMYTAYNQFSFMVLSRVSTASHAVLNVLRRVCVIAAACLFFGTPLSRFNMFGIGIAVLGMFAFTSAKVRAATVDAHKKKS